MTPEPAGAPGYTVALAAPEDYHRGIDVALAVREVTGIPLDVNIEMLSVNLTHRQVASAAVWLAWHGDEAVGHGLATLLDDSHDTWGRVTEPDIAATRAQGLLLELGGLSAHPDHQRRGVAGLIRAAQLAYAREHGYVAVAAVWDASPGSVALAQAVSTRIGTHHLLDIGLFRVETAGTEES